MAIEEPPANLNQTQAYVAPAQDQSGNLRVRLEDVQRAFEAGQQPTIRVPAQPAADTNTRIRALVEGDTNSKLSQESKDRIIANLSQQAATDPAFGDKLKKMEDYRLEFDVSPVARDQGIVDFLVGTKFKFVIPSQDIKNPDYSIANAAVAGLTKLNSPAPGPRPLPGPLTSPNGSISIPPEDAALSARINNMIDQSLSMKDQQSLWRNMYSAYKGSGGPERFVKDFEELEARGAKFTINNAASMVTIDIDKAADGKSLVAGVSSRRATSPQESIVRTLASEFRMEEAAKLRQQQRSPQPPVAATVTPATKPVETQPPVAQVQQPQTKPMVMGQPNETLKPNLPPETPPPYVAPPPVVNVERQPTAEETAARQKVIDAEQAQARAVHNANVAAEAKQASERVWVDKRENPPKVIENLDATLKAMKPPLEMVRVAPSGQGPGSWTITKEGPAMFVESGKFKMGDTITNADNHPFFVRAPRPGAAPAQENAPAARPTPRPRPPAEEPPAAVAAVAEASTGRDPAAVQAAVQNENRLHTQALELVKFGKGNTASPQTMNPLIEAFAAKPGAGPYAELVKKAFDTGDVKGEYRGQIDALRAQHIAEARGIPLGRDGVLTATQRAAANPQVPGFVPEPQAKMPSQAEIAANLQAQPGQEPLQPAGMGSQSARDKMNLPPVEPPSDAARQKQYNDLDVKPAEARRMMEPRSEPNRNQGNAAVASRISPTAGMATDGNSDKFYNTFGLRPALNPDGTPVTIRMADADAKNFPNGKTYMLFEQKDGVGADAVLLTPGQALEAMNDAVNRIPNDRVHEVGPLSEAFRTYIDRASEMASQGDVSFDNVLKPNSLSPAGQAGRERLLNGNAGEGRAETIESNPEQFIRRNSGGAAPAV